MAEQLRQPEQSEQPIIVVNQAGRKLVMGLIDLAYRGCGQSAQHLAVLTQAIMRPVDSPEP